MFQGADKVFRKILVPLAGLQELLLLRDAIRVKRSMLRDLDPERARAVRKIIAKFYNDDDPQADPTQLKVELMEGWSGLKLLPNLKISNPFKKDKEEPATESTPLV